MDVTEQELQELYTWVDDIPLSRPKRNIARDFSDGVLMAEIVHHYYPKLLDLHNYSSANASTQKMYNWNTMNGKVFKRLGFQLAKQDFEAVANCQPGAIERVLKLVKLRLAQCKEEGFTVAAPPTLVPSNSVNRSAPGTLHTMNSGSTPTNGMKEGPIIASYTSGPAPVQQQHQPAAVTTPRTAGSATVGTHAATRAVDRVSTEMIAEKDQTISELKETNEILETKVRKLEQLVRLKDAKIATLMAKLQSAGLT